MAHSTADIRNIALVGHASAGKTLLAEALLAGAGAIGAKGSLDRGTTVCDSDPQEKKLLHSLDSAICHLETGGTFVNLLDTPGIPDFIGRSLSVLEAVETAAVVVSAVAGVEPMTQRMMDFARDRRLRQTGPDRGRYLGDGGPFGKLQDGAVRERDTDHRDGHRTPSRRPEKRAPALRRYERHGSGDDVGSYEEPKAE